MNELLPCPFCGTVPEVTWPYDRDYHIECTECACFGTVELVSDKKDEVILKWNTRTAKERMARMEAFIAHIRNDKRACEAMSGTSYDLLKAAIENGQEGPR